MLDIMKAYPKINLLKKKDFWPREAADRAGFPRQCQNLLAV
jgi:hypothetical protein